MPTWPIIPDAPPANDSSSALIPSSSSPIDSFLGYGLLAPLRRDQKNDFANAGGELLVRSCVSQILGTEASSDYTEGELPWRPEFGSLLHLGKHRHGSLLQELVARWAMDALARWEPRVKVSAVVSTFDPETRILSVFLRYNVIDENVPGNNVILEGIEQTVQLPIAA